MHVQLLCVNVHVHLYHRWLDAIDMAAQRIGMNIKGAMIITGYGQ